MEIIRKRTIRGGRVSDSYRVHTEKASADDVVIVEITKEDDPNFYLEYHIDGKQVENKNSVHFKPDGNGDVVWTACSPKLVKKGK